MAWRDATGAIVYPFEYAILCAMDGAYCAEMNKELAAYQERQEEAARKEAEQAKQVRTRGRRRGAR